MDARNTFNARHNAWNEPNITIMMTIILTTMVETTVVEAKRIILAKLTTTGITTEHLGTFIMEETNSVAQPWSFTQSCLGLLDPKCIIPN
jgi:hypothetical protein